MIYWIKEGNIFTLDGVHSYAHGCNCAGAMGKGIALQFRKRFPEMYLEYKRLCKEGAFTLGDVYAYQHERGYIFNLGTQTSWRTRAELLAVKSSLEKMLSLAEKYELTKIALPRIGAGLGGLNWQEVKEVIEEVGSRHLSIQLYIVEKYKGD